MSLIRFLYAQICVSFLLCLSAGATNLVTGNGFGFAVISPQTSTVYKFYAHPYSFARPDPEHPLGEGMETTNFIKSLVWNTPALQTTTVNYEADSHVIHVRGSAGEGFYFMPFGLQRAALVVCWETAARRARSDGWKVEWSHAVTSHRVMRVLGSEVELLKFDDGAESLLLFPLGPKQTESADEPQNLDGSPAWALVSLENDNQLKQTVQDLNRWRAGLEPLQLVNREIAALEHWRVKPPVGLAEKERHLWRQSEVMLRMAQSREPNLPGRNGNGLIVASLPDGVWSTPWVRDMAWATVALARMGHQDEARAALLAYFNAQPTGKMRRETAGADYQVSVVRYFGDGSEEPFFTMEGSTNIEFDDWGEVLWVLGEYLRQYDDRELLALPTYRGRLYESVREYVVKPLLENLEQFDDGLIVAADTSIWEERQKDKKHFAFSTAAAIAGLREFAEVAQRASDQATQANVFEHIALLEKGFNAAFIRDGHLHGTLEEGVKNDIDGALLTIVNLGVMTDMSIVRDAVQRMELLKVASGGYRRVRSTYTDPSIFEYWYERQEFVFVDFSLAEVYRRTGRNVMAAAMLERIVDKAAADHNIVPEMYVSVPCKLFPGSVGNPTGAKPMVGYGAGAYILNILERESEPRLKQKKLQQ